MRNTALVLYGKLRDSFWFIPALLALVAFLAALTSLWIDHDLGSDWSSDLMWIFWAGTASGGRSVMSVISTSMMTVVSIVYSLTITTLSQTSAHYGPRVLRNFTSDRGNQFVLGAFIATFVFCLTVLRSISSEDGHHFVPFISVNIGVLLGLASLGVLIYYIHHIAQAIQAENLIAGIGRDFEKAVPHLFPKDVGVPRQAGLPADDARWHSAYPLCSTRSGYLIGLDVAKLISLAVQYDVVVRVEKRPGDFVPQGGALLRIYPVENVTAETAAGFRPCYSWGLHRTPDQDILYSIQQMVEIATHALSPGINEPFTAITCLDWLGASLRRVSVQTPPSILRADDDGRLRAIIPHTSFSQMVSASFDQVRLYGCGNPVIVRHLLATIAGLANNLQRHEDFDCLLDYIQLVAADAGAALRDQRDRQDVELTAARARETLLEFQAALPLLSGGAIV